MAQTRCSLAGTWRRLVEGRILDHVPVPGSNPPMGRYTLERDSELPWPPADRSARCFLCTEGALSKARFVVNGREVGTAGPWAPYRFELPAGTLREINVIQAEVADIQETFGPTPGRRFDGGLIRDIYIERRPQTFIESFHFRAGLNADLTAARCAVTVQLNGPGRPAAESVLTEAGTGRVVARARGPADGPIRFALERPRLWSPQTPDLYALAVRLVEGEPDELSEMVGFRRLEVRGPAMLLNNQRLILKGVCRHEFTDAHGYSPPEEVIRRELGMIRQAGFNYVRLVHSPQSGRVCRVAAELGLLVSEEPGACFHDLSDPAVAGPALECLRRTVLRDRNVPSIAAWYIYNECLPCAPYAVQAAAACRELDPDGCISFADCSGRDEEIKAMAEKADLSWYGINLYEFRPEAYVERARAFQDRPLVFTEWGGYWAQGNPRVLQYLCAMFARQTQPEAAPRVAGCSFWLWADYEERSRAEPFAVDGYTIEGLVDRGGAPKPDLLLLSRMGFEMDHPPAVRMPAVTVLARAPRRGGQWRCVPLAAVGGDQAALEAEVAGARRRYAGAEPDFGRLNAAGVDFECRRTPLLLGAGRTEAVIPVGLPVRRAAFLGPVALKGGYPASAVWSVHHRDAEPQKDFGAEAAKYAFEFEGGTVVQVLSHGLHVLRANNICRWWMTAPRSPELLPAVQAVIHPSYEVLRLDLWEIEFAAPRFLKAIRWQLQDENSIQALYAVSVLAAGAGP